MQREFQETPWFLNDKEDVRSSYYLEEVATEFDIQGLELDWVCVAWDLDLQIDENRWDYRSFVGTKWNNINKLEDQAFRLNAYRVLLTRARQGMIIYIPQGDTDDHTRPPEAYEKIYQYLKQFAEVIE
ncbi:DNA/RNA helicase domain-containing protein [Ignatzschineria ureiclastica]|uniref:DNA/RNA helicase domain-containing protein n=1 Tax=Ignatzschineria ureiclastica TaxID=472582 RepID=UPI0023D94D0F|nr:DNA/RNA helicase domain-containing protein [Ignatzschineria ureiclastica]